MALKQFDFVGKKKYFISISAILVLVILASALIFGVQLDIEFKGGTIITYNYTGDVDLDKVEDITKDVTGVNVTVTAKDGLNGADSFDITMADVGGLSADKLNELQAALEKEYGDSIEFLSNSSVEATIGKEFFLKGLVAVAVASVLILGFIAFRFKKINGLSAGFTSVIALIHDVIIVLGAFMVFGLPLDNNFIAVILTILGYSINDTIVIYDRIRENEKYYGKTLPVAELVNKSINESLTRTIHTSVCTISTMVVVCIVSLATGVESILSFALPMMIGMIAGTYSSIFLASPIWVIIQEAKAKRAKKAK